MISTKGRYALRVMIDLAECEDRGYIPLKEVSQRQQISKKYLEIIVKDLVKGGLLSGVSGRGGGYRLCRKPSEYTVGEILEQVDETLSPVACLAPGASPCGRAGECRTLAMWTEFDRMVHDFFYSRTLDDLTVRKSHP